MSGDKCSYFGCRNNRRNTNGSIIFHPFPSNEEMYKIWIINSGNIKLDSLSPKKLKKTYICSSHFNKKDYSNPAVPKSRLNRNAVPKSYLDKTENIDEHKLDSTQNETRTNTTAKTKLMFDEGLSSVVDDENSNTPHSSKIVSKSGTFIVTPEKFDVSMTSKTYQNSKPLSSPQLLFPSPSSISSTMNKTKKWVQELCQMPSPLIKKKNPITREKLLDICKRQKKMLSQKRAIISHLKKQKLKRLNNKQKPDLRTLICNTKFKSKNSKAIVTMQIQHKKRKPWTPEEKKVAFSIYYKSPSTYRYMRKNKITLPGESTMRRWLKSIEYNPGFSNEYMQQIKYKVSSMNYHQKKCVILLDEVALMKCLEYNKSQDFIEGYQDLGQFGRSAKASKNALVIMIRGLYQNWKFPFAFFFSGSGVKGLELAEIIRECMKKLEEVGLNAVGIVCDQGSQNRRMFDILGGTKTEPVVDINGKQICLIYDIPHLIKSLRNNLIDGDIDIDGKKICFKDIKDTYEIDINSKTARSMPKITKTHINPNTWQKMSVKYATQLFSNTVSASIRTCIATGELKSVTAENTTKILILDH